MGEHGIPYTTKSWSPVTGGKRGWTFYDNRLAEPLKWRKPQRVATCFIGDLFGCDRAKWIKAVVGSAAFAPRHQFLLLTKQAEAMAAFFQIIPRADCEREAMRRLDGTSLALSHAEWPIPWIWLGVSITNQADADERLPHLAKLSAAGWRTWVSVEPLLGEVDLRRWLGCLVDPEMACPYETCKPDRCGLSGIEWVVAGGQSGPNAQPCHPDWVRSIRDQCQTAGVPFFVKQLHIDGRLVKDVSEFPEDLRIREFPNG